MRDGIQNRTRGARLTAVAGVFVAAGVGALAFKPAIHNQFVFDDYPFIVKNRAVTQPGPWYRFWRLPYWPKELWIDKLYRPLTTWSFRVDAVRSGHAQPATRPAQKTPDATSLPNRTDEALLDPRPIHETNILLHALTSAGVAWLAWRLTRRPWSAWLAGMLFAAHPLHAEAVATGYGRSELLAGFFAVWLMARYVRLGTSARDPGFYLWGSSDRGGSQAVPPVSSAHDWRGADASSPNADPDVPSSRRSTKPSPWFHVVNAGLLLAAVMSKEHALFVWPVLFVFDAWRYRQIPSVRRPPLRAWLNETAAGAHAGFMLAVSAFMYLRFWLFGWNFRLDASQVRFWESPVAHATLLENVLTPFRFAWLTLKLLLWPKALCPIWSVPALSLPRSLTPDVIAGMILIAGIVVLSVFLWKRSANGPVLLGLLILSALPLQALPLGQWIFAERWLYLPSILIAVLVGTGLDRLSWWGRVTGLAIVVILIPATWQYASKFADFKTMVREVVRRQPDNFQGWQKLSALYWYEGEYQNAIQAAHEVIDRFSHLDTEPPADPYLVLLRSHLALGDGREALDAINTYEHLRTGKPGLSLTEERRRAEELVALSQARTITATAPGGRW